MNLSQLADSLNIALKSGVARAPLTPEIRAESVLAKHWLETNVLVTQEAWNLVTESVNSCDLFERNDWIYLTVPDGNGYQLYIRGVAYWLLARAFHTSVDSALDELRKLIAQEPRRFWRVIGLTGIEVKGRIEVGDDIYLCDPASAPPSPHIEEWTGKPPRLNRGVKSERVTAVLIGEEKAPVRISSCIPSPSEICKPLPVERSNTMHHISKCLPLFGPNAATALPNWQQMEDPSTIPAFNWLPQSSYGISEMRTSGLHPFVDDIRRGEILKSFLILSKKDEGTLSLALSRFSQAMRRRRLEDSAIELRIALEVLLVRDKGDDEPKTHLIRQRGALALAATPSERKTVAKELSEAYSASSSVVHTGKFKNEKQREQIKVGLERCAELLKRFILRPPPADWNEIVFSANSHW